MSARNCRCAIEVVNTSSAWVAGSDGRRAGAITVTSDPVPDDAEHGRGLKIIDAVADNLQLTGNARNGTTITHFEKALDYLPGAAGSLLISAERR